MSDLERMFPDTLRSRDSATFTGSYQTLGGVTTQILRIIKITNNSNVLVTVSWDGTNDHDILPAGSFILLDVMSDRDQNNGFAIPEQTQFYVKGAAGTGSVYLSAYFAR